MQDQTHTARAQRIRHMQSASGGLDTQQTSKFSETAQKGSKCSAKWHQRRCRSRGRCPARPGSAAPFGPAECWHIRSDKDPHQQLTSTLHGSSSSSCSLLRSRELGQFFSRQFSAKVGVTFDILGETRYTLPTCANSKEMAPGPYCDCTAAILACGQNHTLLWAGCSVYTCVMQGVAHTKLRGCLSHQGHA